ncbi:helix-turn-helix domain-containing protein [Phycicoccus sonneratiae]|uniref:Helix-turn-helix domain-containing protein n=1 Tax=Phycicoccus sonneratiae TaxID=2807628 RepID=A0ABS2CJU2_9MICO|nr:helix-turn-helix transcriptional regulator [Phycicoccus sonneraticus]MBM6400152.1 hypothetical protein [Phycicoccus sonneraticus]
MDSRPNSYPTFAAELLEARATLTLGEEIGLALRATRHRLRLSQRAYASLRGWSTSRLARLEAGAERLRLADVVAALEGTEYRLALCRRSVTGPSPPPTGAPAPAGAALPVPVPPEHWPRTELLARVRDGSRRFPGHHDTEQVDFPPRWWWNTEATRVGTVPPHWSAPVPWETDAVGREEGVA